MFLVCHKVMRISNSKMKIASVTTMAYIYGYTGW